MRTLIKEQATSKTLPCIPHPSPSAPSAYGLSQSTMSVSTQIYIAHKCETSKWHNKTRNSSADEIANVNFFLRRHRTRTMK